MEGACLYVTAFEEFLCGSLTDVTDTVLVIFFFKTGILTNDHFPTNFSCSVLNINLCELTSE